MTKKVRKEKDIFTDLAKLCLTPGYPHVIAYLCFRDNFISYSGMVNPDDMLSLFSMDRLVRTEISTLIGLMLKGNIYPILPKNDEMENLIKKTDILLKEIHASMMQPMIDSLNPSISANENFNPFESGIILREAIFYGGESAYNFQYRDLSLLKYKNDDDWLKSNKGFSIHEAWTVIRCIEDIQNKKIKDTLHGIEKKDPSTWTILPAFLISPKDIADRTSLDGKLITDILDAFSPIEDITNRNFVSLDSFNVINAYPLIPFNKGEYLLYHIYGLTQALYETPYYWMGADKHYVNQAMKNRGDFTELFSYDKLNDVFGKDRIYKNVKITDSKDNVVGEIDVLIVYANRAIILQAKSKRLTIEARKGNDSLIKDDFKKAIQDSYDQAFSCAELIENTKYKGGLNFLAQHSLYKMPLFRRSVACQKVTIA